MSTEQNIALVKKTFEEFYNKGNGSNADQYFTSDVKINDPATPNLKSGLSQLKELESGYRNSFPDKYTTIIDIFSVDDKVAVHWTAKGTQKNEFQGVPPTGKTCKISGLTLFRIKNNKISEINQYWDKFHLMEQLGALELRESLRG